MIYHKKDDFPYFAKFNFLSFAKNCFSFQVLAVGFAVMMTRSTDLDWKMRAVYVLPVFIWPVFSYFSHSALVGWTKRRKCSAFDPFLKLYLLGGVLLDLLVMAPVV